MLMIALHFYICSVYMAYTDIQIYIPLWRIDKILPKTDHWNKSTALSNWLNTDWKLWSSWTKRLRQGCSFKLHSFNPGVSHKYMYDSSERTQRTDLSVRPVCNVTATYQRNNEGKTLWWNVKLSCSVFQPSVVCHCLFSLLAFWMSNLLFVF